METLISFIQKYPTIIIALGAIVAAGIAFIGGVCGILVTRGISAKDREQRSREHLLNLAVQLAVENYRRETEHTKILQERSPQGALVLNHQVGGLQEIVLQMLAFVQQAVKAKK